MNTSEVTKTRSEYELHQVKNKEDLSLYLSVLPG